MGSESIKELQESAGCEGVYSDSYYQIMGDREPVDSPAPAPLYISNNAPSDLPAVYGFYVFSSRKPTEINVSIRILQGHFYLYDPIKIMI